MFEKLFWFGAGFLLARYLILNTENYKVKEAAAIDDVRNKVHDLVKKYAPEADDARIGEDVINNFPEN